jgi:hypothetical protein
MKKKLHKRHVKPEKQEKTVKLERLAVVKPEWKNVYDPEYREYFVTQAQLSKSVRKDHIMHLTLYDEQIVPLQGKTKHLMVERKIRTTLIIPEKALERITKFLNNVLEEETVKASEEIAASEEKLRPSDVETSYIR